MRIIRRRVRGRHGKRRRVGKADERERGPRRRQQWRRKAMPDYTGDAFEVARRDPIVGIGRALPIDGTADCRHQFTRLAGVRGHRNCRKRRLENQRERGEPDDREADRAGNIAAAGNVTNRFGNISEQAPKARALTGRPVHPFPDELTLVTPRLQVCPLPSPVPPLLGKPQIIFDINASFKRNAALAWGSSRKHFLRMGVRFARSRNPSGDGGSRLRLRRSRLPGLTQRKETATESDRVLSIHG